VDGPLNGYAQAGMTDCLLDAVMSCRIQSNPATATNSSRHYKPLAEDLAIIFGLLRVEVG
jgi:hypothetical protein